MSTKSVPWPKCKVLYTFCSTLGPPFTESGTYQDTVQKCPKLVVFGCLPAHGLWFCSKVGVQEGFPESNVFGVPAPPILERKLQQGSFRDPFPLAALVRALRLLHGRAVLKSGWKNSTSRCWGVQKAMLGKGRDHTCPTKSGIQPVSIEIYEAVTGDSMTSKR